MSKLSYYTKKNKILLYSITVVIVITLCILLFRHIHSYGEWELYQEPTCNSYGIERRYCNCGEIQDRRLDMLSHTDGEWEFDEINSLRKKKCSVCGSIIEYESMKNHTHAFCEWVTVSEDTCTENGLQTRKCECGLKQENVIQAQGHNYGEWVIVSSPTCLSDGEQKRYCHCGHYVSEILPKLEHIEDNWILNGISKEYHCASCDEIIKVETIQISQGILVSDGKIISKGSCIDNEIVIPEQMNGQIINTIGSKSFYCETAIKSVIMPNSVFKIERFAFYECTSLESIHFGNELTEICEFAFGACSSLTQIKIPQKVTSIKESAFAYCVSLKEVYLPNSIQSICMAVFDQCYNLTDIYYDGTIEEWDSINKDSKWNIGIDDYTIHCSDGIIKQ